MKLTPHLNFNGNCKEALDCYVKILGAKMLMSMTYGDMPKGEGECSDPSYKAPPTDKIMHARIELPNGGGTIMACDVPADRYEKPTGFDLAINLTNVTEAERIYGALSENGKVIMPLGETFWAKKFAMFEDRFGTPWMINVEKER